MDFAHCECWVWVEQGFCRSSNTSVPLNVNKYFHVRLLSIVLHTTSFSSADYYRGDGYMNKNYHVKLELLGSDIPDHAKQQIYTFFFI